jgi:hypothetical protein
MFHVKHLAFCVSAAVRDSVIISWGKGASFQRWRTPGDGRVRDATVSGTVGAALTTRMFHVKQQRDAHTGASRLAAAQ